MPHVVSMPQLGESVAEGTVTKWLKKPGDRVEEDEPLFEVSTDKVETEVPSPASGWLSEILVEEGTTVAVGTQLCIISEEPPTESGRSEAGSAEPAARMEVEAAEAVSGAEAAGVATEDSRGRPPVSVEAAAATPAPSSLAGAAVPPAAGVTSPSSETVAPSDTGGLSEVAAPETGAPAPPLPQEPKVLEGEPVAPETPRASEDRPVEPAEPQPTGTPPGEAFVAAVESAVPTSVGEVTPASQDSRSTMRLRWEPREHELHARPSAPREAPPAPEPRLHAQPSRHLGEASAPPAPPKPQARVTPEGLRRLEHPEEWAAQVRPGGSRRGIYSPAVRKKAAELGVDLEKIVGTGAGGRITLRDVEEAARLGPTEGAAEERVGTESEARPPERAEARVPGGTAPEHARVEPLTQMRIRIAEHMTEARRTAAHCFECVDVEMTAVEEARREHKDAFKEIHGYSLTYLPFVALATCNALLEFPFANARIDMVAKTMTYFDRHVNLGIAVDLDGEGLIVPVIRGAHELTVWELARRIQDLSERARSKKLTPDDVAGGTFTITNPGSFGTKLSVPIINTPEVAILSLEAVEDRPVVRDGAVVVRKMTTLGLSWDHRAFDGADAARFLGGLKARIEGSAPGWDWKVLGAPDVGAGS